MQGRARANPLALQHLAALRWLLLSPSFLQPTPAASASVFEWCVGESAGAKEWLQRLAAQPETLLQWMDARPTKRLGHYAEHLLEFYLTHSAVHHLQAAHLQLRGETGATLGEIDFLLTDASGRRLHWELAVKFFLCMSTASTVAASDFLGPNNVETLAHKWHKVFEKQLAHTAPPPWNENTWQPQAFTRGWMFYRWGRQVPRCPALNPAHCKGFWTPHADMADLPSARYVHLSRLQWMAPVASIDMLDGDCDSGGDGSAQMLNRSEMAQTLERCWKESGDRRDAQMVAQLSDGEHPREVQRFFIRHNES